jgi:hypothetical protein
LAVIGQQRELVLSQLPHLKVESRRSFSSWGEEGKQGNEGSCIRKEDL